MPAAERQPQPDPNEKLVKVFDSEQETEVLVVKGLLDSAGIESDMTSVDAVQDLFPGVGGTVLLVREEDAERARQTIEEYKNAATTRRPRSAESRKRRRDGVSVEVKGDSSHHVGSVSGGMGLHEPFKNFAAGMAVSVASADRNQRVAGMDCRQ